MNNLVDLDTPTVSLILGQGTGGGALALVPADRVLAAQHGWVTVYDSRDDWEEFHKVGMAKWYHPGYERYIAQHADVVSAVSRPLARRVVCG